MSNKPNPACETTAILCRCAWVPSTDRETTCHTVWELASLASRLHRIAPAAQWVAEAACGNGQAGYIGFANGIGKFNSPQDYKDPEPRGSAEIYAYKKAKRLARSMEKLCIECGQLGITLTWGGVILAARH